MSLKKLSRVRSFPEDVTERLAQNGVLTCKDFLTKTPLELMNVLDYTLPQIQSLSVDVCRTIAPTSKTVLTLVRERQLEGVFLPTYLSNLDVALHGGLPNGTITEVTGPPGCGKTQLCLLLSVVSALPVSVGGRGMHVVYIDTESTFNAKRLLQIAKLRYPDHYASLERLATLANDVHVFTEFTSTSFMQRLEHLEQFITEKNIGLVIVDSIASIVRKECDTSSKRGVAERSSLLAKQATRLKYLAEAFKIPVVVTNQVTTQLSHDSSKFSQEIESVVTAALGNSWSHCVNTRLSLEYRPEGKRRLTVAKSPLCGQKSFIVSIEDKGVVLNPDQLNHKNKHCSHMHGDPRAFSLVHTDINKFKGFFLPLLLGLKVEYPGQLS